MKALSSYFFIILREPDLENMALNDMLNHRGVFSHIDCQ